MENVKKMVDRLDNMKREVTRKGLTGSRLAEVSFDYMSEATAAYPYLRAELDRLWELEKQVESGMVAA